MNHKTSAVAEWVQVGANINKCLKIDAGSTDASACLANEPTEAYYSNVQASA